MEEDSADWIVEHCKNNMRYEIIGEPMPVVVCHLEDGESIQNESGAMVWMSSNMKMETTSGGIGKAFSRMFSGESLFLNHYTAQNGPGMIAFASNVPGSIRAIDVSGGKTIIAQKSAFLAATMGVDISIHFQKKLGAGFFGGEGFIMEKISGNGLVFLEIDGSCVEYTLNPGQELIVDTGNLAYCDESCSIDVRSVGSVKNAFFGGEGIFNTVVTGPGKVALQTMPVSSLANTLSRFIPHKN